MKAMEQNVLKITLITVKKKVACTLGQLQWILPECSAKMGLVAGIKRLATLINEFVEFARKGGICREIMIFHMTSSSLLKQRLTL